MLTEGTFPLVATTLQGMEDLLSAELRGLGVKHLEKGSRAVRFDADRTLLYKVNMSSRLAIKILRPLFRFEASNDDQLYAGCHSYNWANLISPDNTFAVDKVVYSPHFKNSQYCSLLLKDAVVDRIREEVGRRPNVDLKSPEFPLHLRISDNQVYVSLNTSGAPLFKRGYRKQQGFAPLNEVLASGLIQLTDWDRESPLYDFMTGSGTIGIEAAFLRNNKLASFFRRDFALMNWKDFDRELWKNLRREGMEEEKDREQIVFSADKDLRTIQTARNNISYSGLKDSIRLSHRMFEESPKFNNGTVILNPPYGQRLPIAMTYKLYSNIGDTLKRNFSGCTAWILSSNMDAIKKIGLRPSKKIPLFNGALECKFLKFELYDGSKKASKNRSTESKTKQGPTQ